jgi:hypothetical protein
MQGLILLALPIPGRVQIETEPRRGWAVFGGLARCRRKKPMVLLKPDLEGMHAYRLPPFRGGGRRRLWLPRVTRMYQVESA